MPFLKYRIIFYIGFILILAMVMGGSAIAAFASTSPVTTTIKAGSLSLSGPTSVNAGTVTLQGRSQTLTYTLPLRVIDARGSGAGWNLSITSTPFTSGSRSMANNASSIGSVMEACNVGSTCRLATDSVSYPVGIPAGTPPPPAVTFFNATTKSGLGDLAIKPMISILVPANTHVGVYTSNVYVTLVNGQKIQIVVTLAVQRKGDDPPSASTIKYILPFSFNDPGTTSWHLSITSTQFATESTPVHTLPTTASSLVGMTGVCRAAQNCSDKVATFILLPAGDPAPNPVTFYVATANAGIGTVNVVAALEVVIPGNAYPGPYSSTVTIAFQSGP